MDETRRDFGKRLVGRVGAALGLDYMISRMNPVIAEEDVEPGLTFREVLGRYKTGSVEYTVAALVHLPDNSRATSKAQNRIMKSEAARQVIFKYQTKLRHKIKTEDDGKGNRRLSIDGKLLDADSMEYLGIKELYDASIRLGYAERGKQPESVGLKVLYNKAKEANVIDAPQKKGEVIQR